MSRRPWLSGFGAFVVLLASLAAVEIRPPSADPTSWRGAGDSVVALSAERADGRLARVPGGRDRSAGAAAPGAWLGFACLPLPAVLPPPGLSRTDRAALPSFALRAPRSGVHGARGPPARAA